MGNARLKSITLKGFRSFAEESTVTFPETGMVLFRGQNMDTGGSSGSGKSSLLLAIAYLLGFSKFPGTALQSWLTDEPMEVKGVFEVDEGELVVSRGQKLALTLNGKKIGGSAKHLEGELDRLIGLPAELRAALTYRGQKQPGLFLSKTDSAKKEFLTVVLDLGKYEVAVEESQARASKELEPRVRTLEYVVTEARKKLEGYRTGFRPAALQSESEVQRELGEAEENRGALRDQIDRLRSELRSAEARIEAEVAELRQRHSADIAAREQAVADLEAAKPDLSSIDTSVLERLQGDLEQAEGFLQEELAADQLRRKSQQAKADSVYSQLRQVEARLAQQPGIGRRLEEINREIAKLDASVCPTCDRTWDEAQARKGALAAEAVRLSGDFQIIEELKPQAEALRAEHRTLSQFDPSPAIGELRGIIAQLRQDVAVEEQNIAGQAKVLEAGIAQQLAEAKAALNEKRVAVSREVEHYRASAREQLVGSQDKLERLEGELGMVETRIRGLTASLSRIQIDNARETERVAQVEKQIAALESDLAANEAALAKEQQALNAELDFQRLIGREGFLGAIFDEVLAEISDETNRLLAQFPNTAHVTLRFTSEAISQKGTVRKSITPVVTIGGHEAPLAAGLSGGMETAVELAVDLAVATVVSQRTGACPGWLILDEAFTGLGPVEAEASMEILRAFAEDKLVLVVDHGSEFKSLFTEFVDVQYSGGKSRVWRSL